MPGVVHPIELDVAFRLFDRKFDGQRIAIQRLFAKLFGINSSTPHRWFTSDKLPAKGEEANQLRVFLQMLGYRIKGLSDQSRMIRELAETMAFQILSADDIAKRVGYVRGYEVQRILRGEMTKLPSDRRRKLEALLKQAESERTSRMANWKALTDEALGTNLTGGESVARAPSSVETETVVQELSHEPQIVASLVTALSATLDAGNRDTGLTLKPEPNPIPTGRKMAIWALVDSDVLRRLRGQLDELLEAED